MVPALTRRRRVVRTTTKPRKPTRNDVSGTAGRIVARLNINVNTEDPIVTAGSVVEPNTFYSYTLDDAASVPSIVVQLAGVGKLGI